MADSTPKASLLIIDDNSKNLQILAEMLRQNNYRVATAKDGLKAINFAKKRKPDLLMLDVMMPEIDGFEVCRRLKEDPDTSDIPIIFISALADTEDKVKGFQAGGVDYITKPFQKEEVLARVDTHVELKRSREDLKDAYRKLYEANKELERAAHTDSLTKLSNRRDITEKMLYEKKRSERSDKTFCLIIGDIDDFKQFNDRYGHECGDEVLVDVAALLRDRVRKQDVVSRWGGEEFLLLLPETDLPGGKALAEMLLSELEKYEFEYNGLKLNISMTFGVSDYQKGENIEQCIKHADDALLEGKRAGKNRVSVISRQ